MLEDGSIRLAVTSVPFMLHIKMQLPLYGTIWVMAHNCGEGYDCDFVDFTSREPCAPTCPRRNSMRRALNSPPKQPDVWKPRGSSVILPTEGTTPVRTVSTRSSTLSTLLREHSLKVRVKKSWRHSPSGSHASAAISCATLPQTVHMRGFSASSSTMRRSPSIPGIRLPRRVFSTIPMFVQHSPS